MSIPPPPSRAPRRPRRPQGVWLKAILPHFADYKAAPNGGKMKFVRQLSQKLGQAENTTRRQLAALIFLEKRKVDLSRIAERAPALMSIAAVARAGRVDYREEGRLLGELLEGAGSAKGFRAAVGKIGRDRDVGEARDGDWVELLRQVVPRPDQPFEVRYASAAFAPSAIIQQDGVRSAVILAQRDDAYLKDSQYGVLIEAAVLRSLVRYDWTHLVADVELPELDDTCASFKPEIARIFTWRRARLDRGWFIDGARERYESVEMLELLEQDMEMLGRLEI